MKRQLNLWDGAYTMEDALEHTVASLQHYRDQYEHWCVAFSGGKDSTTAATVVSWAVRSGQVRPPSTLVVLMSDTRMEIPALEAQAQRLLAEMRAVGIQTRVVQPPIDKRFYNYMLGRGVPPPKNRFRWCTSMLKVQPMMDAIRDLAVLYGEKFLMITGVRRGESASRDLRIEAVCSKDDGECGLGMWLGPSESDPYATLAPLLHWRTCQIWDWLTFEEHRHGFHTARVADIYGDEEHRTGCICCPLVDHDEVLEKLIRRDLVSARLAPLLELRQMWPGMRLARWRKRKRGERLQSGAFSSSPMRLGPLTMEARAYFLDWVLDIQRRAAHVLVDAEDERFIRQCWKDGVWPDRWSGDEENGDVLMDNIFSGGVTQAVLQGLNC